MWVEIPSLASRRSVKTGTIRRRRERGDDVRERPPTLAGASTPPGDSPIALRFADFEEIAGAVRRLTGSPNGGDWRSLLTEEPAPSRPPHRAVPVGPA
jgi:hypothetical protein